jgi:hypothetical protein
MADAKEKHGEVSHISICAAENGYKICCTYESPKESLGVRAGWYSPGPGECKDYVEKTKDAVLKRLKELL